MFNYNNTHIFTGYLKQLLSSVNIPTCKVYTKEFADYFNKTGCEDPRVVESIDTIGFKSGLVKYPGAQINYLKDNKIMSYKWKNPSIDEKEDICWSYASEALFMGDNRIDGLTRTFSGSGKAYDSKTHNYLGDFLRFLRDYHNVNLMSLYNCFDNKIYNNVYLSLPSEKQYNSSLQQEILPEITISSSDPTYKIYAVPVKLFENYTIAIDCSETLELFCGFYSTRLDTTDKGRDLIRKTYKKVSKTFFHKPFLYTELDVQKWNRDIERIQAIGKHGECLNMPMFAQKEKVNRWDILNREQDLKLFIKIPVSCKSSITILEGDYRTFNDFVYKPEVVDEGKNTLWKYKQNTCKINFQTNSFTESYSNNQNLPPLNERTFTPISKLQLLYLNTGESHPFADRLVEYLTGSATTAIDEISDNIKRAQNVMSKNGFTFDIKGLWEPKMQLIAYDYIMNSGPVYTKSVQEIDQDGKPVTTHKLVDLHRGSHPQLGHKSNSSMFDILGYIDKDVEKLYASWQLKTVETNSEMTKGTCVAKDTIQETDIYNGLYNLD